MFRHRQQLRRWAARALLLWLFGIGVGVANACLTTHSAEPGGPLGGPAFEVGALTDEAMAPASAHHHGSGQADREGTLSHHGSAAQSSCHAFCEKAGISIPSLKSALDDVQGHALFLPAVAAVVPAPALVPVRLWVPRRDGVRAPPIPIAFLRLAL